MDTFTETILNLGADKEIVERALATRELYKKTSVLFDIYKDLFQIFLRFDFNQMNHGDLLQATASPLLDVFRYGWLFLLFTQGNLLN